MVKLEYAGRKACAHSYAMMTRIHGVSASSWSPSLFCKFDDNQGLNVENDGSRDRVT